MMSDVTATDDAYSEMEVDDKFDRGEVLYEVFGSSDEDYPMGGQTIGVTRYNRGPLFSDSDSEPEFEEKSDPEN